MKNRTKIIILSISAIAVFAALAYFYFQDDIQEELYPVEYAEFVSRASNEFGVDKAIIFAVIRTESGFKPSAASGAGAQGLMQLIPDTFTWIAGKLSEKAELQMISDPLTNIRYGTYFLSYLYNRYQNWDVAFAAYNAGHGRVDSWLSDSRYSDDGKTLKNIPYPETEKYVKLVNKSKLKYEKML